MLRILHRASFLERVLINGCRYYLLPKSKIAVPSVTTVLYDGESFTDSPFMVQSRNRGTAVHDIVESYLKGEPISKKAMPSNIETFHKFKKAIDAHLTEVWYVESHVYSHELLTAGALDCYGRWGGHYSVIDWKTSRRPKTREQIDKYFTQVAVYGRLVKETHPMIHTPKHGVVVIANDEDPEPQVFMERIDTPELTEKVNSIYVKNRR